MGDGGANCSDSVAADENLTGRNQTTGIQVEQAAAQHIGARRGRLGLRGTERKYQQAGGDALGSFAKLRCALRKVKEYLYTLKSLEVFTDYSHEG